MALRHIYVNMYYDPDREDTWLMPNEVVFPATADCLEEGDIIYISFNVLRTEPSETWSLVLRPISATRLVSAR